MQLETDGGRVELLRNKGDLYRRDSSQNDWPATAASPAAIVTALRPPPVVVGGIIYVPSGNECYTSDAGSGREVWHFQRQHTKSQVNRGVAVSGDSRFHRHRQRSPAGIESLFSISDLGSQYGGCQPELFHNLRAVSGWRCRCLWNWRRRCARIFFPAFDMATGKELWRL